MSDQRQHTTPKNILLTGRPGVGKTTVIIRLAELLAGRKVTGFYTEEIRHGTQRQGFQAATFSHRTIVLAHVNFKTGPRVGRYRVSVSDFEQLVLPELNRPADMILIDEIGKMECFSSPFIEAVRRTLDGSSPIVATVAIKGGGFIAEVKARRDVQLLHVTRDNRDQLASHLADLLLR